MPIMYIFHNLIPQTTDILKIHFRKAIKTLITKWMKV